MKRQPAKNSRTDTGRVFRIGFVVNSGLAVLKLTVGLLAGSPALIADGWHSLSDIGTNLGAWLAYHWSLQPPDEDHHYGHGNGEALSGVVVGLVLVFGGGGVIWSGLASEVQLEEGVRGHLALGVAVFSGIANLWLARVTARAAKGSGSQGLLALTRDNLSDALAGVLVVLAILGSKAGVAWAEPLAAVVIGGLIIWMGFSSASEGIDVLMDRIRDPELRVRLETSAAATEGVRCVQRVRVHPLGASYRVDMEIGVDGSLSVAEGHHIAHSVELRVRSADARVEEVHVHVNPWVPESVADTPVPPK